MFKYGLYEIFKDYYMNLAGEEVSKNYKGAIWLAGFTSTEFFANIALCPLEMTTTPCILSPVWDTDSEQGFIQAPTGLRERERGKGEDEATDIGP
jgi:hypothetical protein